MPASFFAPLSNGGRSFTKKPMLTWLTSSLIETSVGGAVRRRCSRDSLEHPHSDCVQSFAWKDVPRGTSARCQSEPICIVPRGTLLALFTPTDGISPARRPQFSRVFHFGPVSILPPASLVRSAETITHQAIRYGSIGWLHEAFHSSAEFSTVRFSSLNGPRTITLECHGENSRRRQSEGWRGQNDYRHQSRRLPRHRRTPGVACRLRSPGQRLFRPRISAR